MKPSRHAITLALFYQWHSNEVELERISGSRSRVSDSGHSETCFLVTRPDGVRSVVKSLSWFVMERVF